MVCPADESSTPYYAAREMLRDLLGLSPSDQPAQVAGRLRDRVEANDPDLVPWLPLLGIALDVAMPDSPETTALEDQFRPARLAEVATRFLAIALPTPTLIVVEDAHWMDEASGEVFKRLVAEAADHPWVVVAARREGEHGFRLPDVSHASSVVPAPLGEVEALGLAEVATESAPLPYHQLALIARRSAGNPLFLLALVAAAQAGGDIEALPDSVEAVLMARIDRLAPRDRT